MTLTPEVTKAVAAAAEKVMVRYNGDGINKWLIQNIITDELSKIPTPDSAEECAIGLCQWLVDNYIMPRANQSSVGAEIKRRFSDATRFADAQNKELRELVERMKRELKDRRLVGGMMANICFNLKQRDDQIPRDREIFKDCQEKWDSIKRWDAGEDDRNALRGDAEKVLEGK